MAARYPRAHPQESEITFAHFHTLHSQLAVASFWCGVRLRISSLLSGPPVRLAAFPSGCLPPKPFPP
jgi:hypothetical protein